MYPFAYIFIYIIYIFHGLQTDIKYHDVSLYAIRLHICLRWIAVLNMFNRFTWRALRYLLLATMLDGGVLGCKVQRQERVQPNWTSDKTIVIVSNFRILQEAILPADMPIKNKQIIMQRQSLQDPYQATMISCCKWLGSQDKTGWSIHVGVQTTFCGICVMFAMDYYSCFLINMQM